MLYQRPSFTLPSAPNTTSQKRWDFSVMTKREFIVKYGRREYTRLTSQREE